MSRQWMELALWPLNELVHFFSPSD